MTPCRPRSRANRPSNGFAVFFSGLAALLVASGCGSTSTGPDTFAVSGIVTQAGKPVSGAIVSFIPAGESGGVPGQATTGDDGSFEASIYLDNGKTTKSGLPAGAYKVTVIKMQLPGGEASITKPPKNVLPAKFATPESTPLEAKVDPAGANRFDYAL